jgi:hypothetical protein
MLTLVRTLPFFSIVTYEILSLDLASAYIISPVSRPDLALHHLRYKITTLVILLTG